MAAPPNAKPVIMRRAMNAPGVVIDQPRNHFDASCGEPRGIEPTAKLESTPGLVDITATIPKRPKWLRGHAAPDDLL
jgi:hypothetical protein